MMAHDIYFVPLIRTWALINGMGASSPCPSVVMITHTHIYISLHMIWLLLFRPASLRRVFILSG